MIANVEHNDQTYQIDLLSPLDISIPLRGDAQNVNAWGLAPPKITPHIDGDFVGKVSVGAPINFNDIAFNPHAHGTHTECVGHITEEFHSINQNLDHFFSLAELISVTPELQNDDWVFSKHILELALQDKKPTALVLRSMPNDRTKLSRQYSGTNPPYLLEDAVQFLVDIGVEHLLIDLPSVDKENDGGQLLAHKAFWDFDGQLRKQATITELIYVPNGVVDGRYFLNLQVAPFENDASPSRPVLYKILEK
ncbi:Kynurenine formamidase [Pricia antarctica]|uniref:Kynurenine formamidase n=1 Tax=Pricia antarctica TaxID=641691 RepID=A0A1G6Z317_9FLAO|nr:cyclase family protein [Pricia antarctica]SDD96683.1 Kynurenine formamidase [Pricia antarctica]